MKIFSNSKRGEIATILALATVAVLGISTLISSVFVNNKQSISFTPRAAENTNCAEYPNIAAPDGYKWKANCQSSCNGNSTCPKNTCDGAVAADSSAWCYGFTDGAHCIMLTHNGGPTSCNSAVQTIPTPTPLQCKVKCGDRPEDPYPDGYDWLTECGQTCKTNADCQTPPNGRSASGSSYQNITWCYGNFVEGNRCMYLYKLNSFTSPKGNPQLVCNTQTASPAPSNPPSGGSTGGTTGGGGSTGGSTGGSSGGTSGGGTSTGGTSGGGSTTVPVDDTAPSTGKSCAANYYNNPYKGSCVGCSGKIYAPNQGVCNNSTDGFYCANPGASGEAQWFDFKCPDPKFACTTSQSSAYGYYAGCGSSAKPNEAPCASKGGQCISEDLYRNNTSKYDAIDGGVCTDSGATLCAKLKTSTGTTTYTCTANGGQCVSESTYRAGGWTSVSGTCSQTDQLCAKRSTTSTGPSTSGCVYQGITVADGSTLCNQNNTTGSKIWKCEGTTWNQNWSSCSSNEACVNGSNPNTNGARWTQTCNSTGGGSGPVVVGGDPSSAGDIGAYCNGDTYTCKSGLICSSNRCTSSNSQTITIHNNTSKKWAAFKVISPINKVVKGNFAAPANSSWYLEAGKSDTVNAADLGCTSNSGIIDGKFEIYRRGGFLDAGWEVKSDIAKKINCAGGDIYFYNYDFGLESSKVTVNFNVSATFTNCSTARLEDGKIGVTVQNRAETLKPLLFPITTPIGNAPTSWTSAANTSYTFDYRDANPNNIGEWKFTPIISLKDGTTINPVQNQLVIDTSNLIPTDKLNNNIKITFDCSPTN